MGIPDINNLHVYILLFLIGIFFVLIACGGIKLKLGWIELAAMPVGPRVALGIFGVMIFLLGLMVANVPINLPITNTYSKDSHTPVPTSVIPGPISDPQTYYVNITARAPSWQDSLVSQDNNGWKIVSNAVRRCDFENASYVVTRNGSDYSNCPAQQPDFTNFIFRVQMKMFSGDYGGIEFRYDASNDQFYYFRIDQNGAYQLKVSVDQTFSDDKTLVINPSSSSLSSLFKPGSGTSNSVAVLADQNYFYLFVNDHYIGYAKDATYQSGEIGFLVGNSTSNQTVVAFSDAQVWQLT